MNVVEWTAKIGGLAEIYDADYDLSGPVPNPDGSVTLSPSTFPVPPGTRLDDPDAAAFAFDRGQKLLARLWVTGSGGDAWTDEP